LKNGATQDLQLLRQAFANYAKGGQAPYQQAYEEKPDDELDEH